MSNKAQYQTKQRDELRTYLKNTSGPHITVNNVCEHFKKQGKIIRTKILVIFEIIRAYYR